MDLSKGLEQLKQGINKRLNQERDTLIRTFDQLKEDVERYVSDSAGAYSSLSDFSEQKNQPQRGKEPDGFANGFEVIAGSNPQKKIEFPLVYSFKDKSATAIEENSGCAHLLFNYALRSIISYPIGDCNVYMVDSNVSGDFNQLAQISTRLDDAEAEKPYFHYITSEDEKDNLLSTLSSIMDSNIRNYVFKYKDLPSYNMENQSMHVPYHFVFIKNITEAYPERSQIDRLVRIANSGNAMKAGIYIFYTYDKSIVKEDPDSYYADMSKSMKYLLNLSHVIEKPKQHYPGSELRLEPKATPEVAERVVRYVETQEPPVTIMSFKDQIQKKLASGTLWTPAFKREPAHLPFIVGFENAVTPKVVDVRFSKISPHMFIGGKTGSGKSILLHNFIINGALRYSPSQLQFYLVDMKGGVSFAPYKDLPHVVAMSASSSRHYAMSLLELFSEENKRRLALFKRVVASNLDDYNEVMVNSGKEPLPYLFGIIDEFQGLFDNMDDISKNAEAKIKEIHKLSRAAGVFLALCTQQAPGNVDRSQVGIKISLVCNPNDSVTLIGNSAASRLRGIGRAIINTHDTGEEKFNQEFQVAFIHERKELPLYIDKIREIYLKQNGGIDSLDHFCYDDNDRAARLSKRIVDAIMHQSENATPYIYIGAPSFFRKEHVKFWFQRDSQSNVAMVGNDRPAALRLTGIIAIQFMSAYKNTGAKVYISDLQKSSESTYGKLSFLGGKQDISCTGSMELKDTMKEVYQMLCKRKETPGMSVKEPEVLYAILDLKPDNNFSGASLGGFNFGGAPSEKGALDMLKELIDEGPDYGIHILAYSYNYANMDSLLNAFNNSLLPKMEVKIALRGGNSAKVISLFGSGEVVENYGEAVIHMPEKMGLRYKDDKHLGDPFLIYDTLDDRRLQGSVWDTLFKNLPNKED